MISLLTKRGTGRSKPTSRNIMGALDGSSLWTASPNSRGVPGNPTARTVQCFTMVNNQKRAKQAKRALLQEKSQQGDPQSGSERRWVSNDFTLSSWKQPETRRKLLLPTMSMFAVLPVRVWIVWFISSDSLQYYGILWVYGSTHIKTNNTHHSLFNSYIITNLRRCNKNTATHKVQTIVWKRLVNPCKYPHMGKSVQKHP